MNVYLFKFNKRINSTQRPVTSDGTLAVCQLKDETSFLNPQIRVNKDIMPGLFSPSGFNYAYIPYWQRYYYINDWTYLNGVWECSCSVDVLASFKSAIGYTSSYIIRSASAYDGKIMDSFYPAKTEVAIQKVQISSDIFRKTIPGGCFIVGIINNANSSYKMGAVIYYAMTITQMTDLLNYLFSSNIYNNSNIQEIGEGLYKSLFDPFQYIVSCMWFPATASQMGDSTGSVTVGYWDTGIDNVVIANLLVREIGFKTALPIPLHPQSSRGDYLNHAPFTKLTAYYPPFGEIPIDTMFCQYGTNNYLYGKMYWDFVTGLADCYFSITDGYDTDTTADPYKYMCMRSAQIGVPIQISQVMSDYVSTLSNGVGAVGSLLSGNIAGIFSNLTSAVEASMPKVSSLGANGSLIEILTPPYLIVEHYRQVDQNNTEFGRPLCQTRTINTLSGFIQCGESDHAFSGTRTENEEINRYMREGFFYE